MPPRGPMRAPAKPKNAKGTFKRLLDLMKEYKVRLLLVVLCIIATTGISSLTTYMLQPVYATIGDVKLSCIVRVT